MDSPTRSKNNVTLSEDEAEEEQVRVLLSYLVCSSNYSHLVCIQFSPDDLMSASRLLNRELKSLQSIFECYPSYSSSSRAGTSANSIKGAKGAVLFSCFVHFDFSCMICNELFLYRSVFRYCHFNGERF